MKNKVFGVVTLLLACLLVSGYGNVAAQGGGGKPAGSHPVSQPQDTQDFQDVPTTYLFYGVIHDLFVDSVIGGYPCGGPGEPCVPPANLPYFRPSANVTRAQNAKFTDLGRRKVTGVYTGTNPYYGIFTALNTNITSENNAGIYAQGGTGIWADAYTSGATRGFGAFIRNFGGGTLDQYGLYVGNQDTSGAAGYGGYFYTVRGWGLYGGSTSPATGMGSYGVVGVTNFNGDAAGGVFTATDMTVGNGNSGIYATGWSGAVLNGANGTAFPGGDGLDVGANGLPDNYAIDAQQPAGDTYYSLYGVAHIHGTNISGADYESEVVYDGAAPLAIGSVVALDPNNQMGGALGVVKADASTADTAIGVISYRLDTMKEGKHDKTYIDAAASSVSKSDRAYITILGRVKMKLGDSAKVGSRLTLDANGTVAVAGKDTLASFGKVASQPDKDGYAYVLVNFK